MPIDMLPLTIKVLPPSSATESLYNTCYHATYLALKNHGYATEYYSALWYIKAACSRFKFAAAYDASGNLVALLALPQRHFIRGSNYCQPLFTQRFAPVFLPAITANGFDDINIIKSNFFDNVIPTIIPFTDVLCLSTNTLHIGRKAPNYILNGNGKSLSELQANYATNHTRNLAKANPNLAFGVNVSSADSIIKLFRQHKGVTIDGLKTRHYHRLKAILTAAANNNALTIATASIDGNIVSASILIGKGANLINLLNITTPEGKDAFASFFLFDNIITYLHQIDSHFNLDFEGSAIDGVARFYAGFGATNVPYTIIAKA